MERDDGNYMSRPTFASRRIVVNEVLFNRLALLLTYIVATD
jgi:hypothetical protein